MLCVYVLGGSVLTESCGTDGRRVLSAMVAMNLDLEQLQADLAANRQTHLVATCKLLRHQQIRNKRLILSRQSSRSSSKVCAMCARSVFSAELMAAVRAQTSMAHPSSTEDLGEASDCSIKRATSAEGLNKLAPTSSGLVDLVYHGHTPVSSLSVGGGLQRSNSVRDVSFSARSDRDALVAAAVSMISPPTLTPAQRPRAQSFSAQDPSFSPLTTQSVPEFITTSHKRCVTRVQCGGVCVLEALTSGGGGVICSSFSVALHEGDGGGDAALRGNGIGNILEDDEEDSEPDARNHRPRPAAVRRGTYRGSQALIQGLADISSSDKTYVLVTITTHLQASDCSAMHGTAGKFRLTRHLRTTAAREQRRLVWRTGLSRAAYCSDTIPITLQLGRPRHTTPKLSLTHETSHVGQSLSKALRRSLR